MTPAEVLAAAADRLDALIAGASDGPWQVEGLKETPVSDETTWYLEGIERWRGMTNSVHLGEDEGTARYIAAMNPLVGKALAEVLRNAAKNAETLNRPPYTSGASVTQGDSDLLMLARLIIGGES